MNIAEFVLVAAPSIGLGVVIGASLRGATVRKLNEIVEAKDIVIGHKHSALLTAEREIAEADGAAAKARDANRALERKLGRAEAEVARLTPLAEKAEAAQRQRIAASQAAHAKRRLAEPPTIKPTKRAGKAK